MKIIKLNRRFSMHRDHGHAVALRFSTWNQTAAKYEQAVHDMLGSQYEWTNWQNYPHWRGYFGKASGHTPQRPYWITFRDPAYLTMVILRVDQKG
jgi:hypothetical protein